MDDDFREKVDGASDFLEEMVECECNELGDYIQNLLYLWRYNYHASDEFNVHLGNEILSRAKYMHENYTIVEREETEKIRYKELVPKSELE